MKLRWQKVNGDTWTTDEARDGTPDFTIMRTGTSEYRMKMRTARTALWFDRLQDAKDYAESCGGEVAGAGLEPATSGL